jgi:uncharacterized Zn finger protein (UPF0148 family)
MQKEKYMKHKYQERVQKILEDFSKIDKKKIPNKDKSIYMEKFFEIPEVKQVIKELKSINITGKDLCKMGFIPAGIMLGRKL